MKYIFLLSSFLCFCFSAAAYTDTTKIRSIFDDFYQADKIVNITVQFDVKSLIDNKLKQEKYAGIIWYENTKGKQVSFHITIETRGKLRLEICEFPLLKLDFSKKDLIKAGFEAEFDELKMITHCKDNKHYIAPMLKEWLAYKMYNTITEKSLRTQLLFIRYIDFQGKTHNEEYAFIIEPVAALAHRLGYRHNNDPLEKQLTLEMATYNNMILFQYMIGNVDWRINSQHNIEILEDTLSKLQLVVPYDFDYADMVAAPYATREDRGGEHIFGHRILAGTFSDEAGFKKTIQHFITKESAILDNCNNFTLLDKKERARISTYLHSFFDAIKNPQLTLQQMYRN